MKMAGMQNTALSINESTLVHRRPIVLAARDGVHVMVPQMEKIICMRINQKIKKV